MVDTNSVDGSEHDSCSSGLYSGWEGRQGYGSVDGPHIYLDTNVTPYEAATLILAAFGPVFVNELIDALIDVLEIQPNRDKEP